MRGMKDQTAQLFRIKVLHAAPKDVHESIEGYVVAETEQQVFEYVDKVHCFGSWSESEETRTVCKTKPDGDEYEVEVPFAEWVMAERGDLEDESGFEDAYYGVTKHGWGPVGEVTEADVEVLVRLGIAVDLRTAPGGAA